MRAGAGNDTILSGAGNDLVLGEAGDDSINGGAGNDTITAGDGNDTIIGGAGANVLSGSAGNDVIVGGSLTADGYIDDDAADTPTGGAGADMFIVGNNDIITDFTASGDTAENDSTDLSSYYNQQNLAIINQARIAANLQPYGNPLAWLRADQADDGVLNSFNTANGFDRDFTLTVQNAGAAVSADLLGEAATNVNCFTSDVLIERSEGPVPARDLCVGMLVKTRNAGLQPIRWIGRRRISAAEQAVSPNLRSVRIRRHALGLGLPAADLLISQQHRVLVRSSIAQRMFGACEVLVAAKHLCEVDGIVIVDDLEEVITFTCSWMAIRSFIRTVPKPSRCMSAPRLSGASTPQPCRKSIRSFPSLRQGQWWRRHVSSVPGVRVAGWRSATKGTAGCSYPGNP